VRHGNEDTFREMLRIKRSVAASYSAVHLDSATAAAAEAAGQGGGGAGQAAAAAAASGLDSMEALEAAAEAAAAAASRPALKGFVSAGVCRSGGPHGAARPPPARPCPPRQRAVALCCASVGR
jgi:pre-mRNA-splicing factor SYF1